MSVISRGKVKRAARSLLFMSHLSVKLGAERRFAGINTRLSRVHVGPASHGPAGRAERQASDRGTKYKGQGEEK